ncbi:MAG TPA: competence protein ComK [Bacilli bacterium]|nr:competence protein ComK [Bacilli bacterium]HPZ23295.1 competence protein ComK [Bacilli bacterium]HQC83265.1 competence protein ComK [Bacilli bacterium]
MKDYIITDKTLAILPFGIHNSLVYEHNNVIIVNKKPNNIIKRNCMYHGSSFDGRIKGTEQLTGYTYKAPICIADKENIIFFPTSSPRLKECSWLSLNNIDNYTFDNSKNISIIKFINNTSIEIDVSKNILNNQVLRATRLGSKIVRKYE